MNQDALLNNGNALRVTPEGIYIWQEVRGPVWGLPIVNARALTAPTHGTQRRLRMALRRASRRRGARERTYRLRRARRHYTENTALIGEFTPGARVGLVAVPVVDE